MRVDNTRFGVDVVCEVSQKSVLFGEANDCKTKLSKGFLVLFHGHRALLGHVIQVSILLAHTIQSSLRLLQFLIDISHTPCLIIRTSLVKIENTLFLAELFQLALCFVELSDKCALGAL